MKVQRCRCHGVLREGSGGELQVTRPLPTYSGAGWHVHGQVQEVARGHARAASARATEAGRGQARERDEGRGTANLKDCAGLVRVREEVKLLAHLVIQHGLDECPEGVEGSRRVQHDHLVDALGIGRHGPEDHALQPPQRSARDKGHVEGRGEAPEVPDLHDLHEPTLEPAELVEVPRPQLRQPAPGALELGIGDRGERLHVQAA
mmetsp:Transcript_14260/g.39090  ORF Transcript_14260/g.39090 Transcript_14260/m.39090 type:complete len:205 (+) Transcript_14260:432-1046(+)